MFYPTISLKCEREYMKPFLISLISLVSALSWAAGIPEKHPTDSFQIGISSSSAQKNYLFDLGLGSNNPKLGVDTTINALNYSKNTFSLGDGASSQKSFVANVGSGANNPKIIWNASNTDWEFSNDGTNFTPIGSGSGSTGINLLANPGFESGVTQGWTNTGGTFSSVTSGSNLLVGRASATFQSTASGQSIQSTLYSIPNGLKSRSCVVQVLFKGGDANYTLQVSDGTNVLGSTAFYSSTIAAPLAVPFLCPSSGSIQLKIRSSAAGAILALDEMFLGQNTLVQVGQATFYGSVLYPQTTGCIWNQTSVGSTDAVFPANASCPAPTLQGFASTPATKIPAITFPSLPPGRYQIFATSLFYIAQNNEQCLFSFTDGTNSTLAGSVIDNGNSVSTPHILGELNYTTAQTNVTLQMQVRGLSSSNCTIDPGTSTGLLISVYRFPSDVEFAVKPETINWKVGFANTFGSPDLGASAVSSNTPISGTTNFGVSDANGLHALTPCSGTDAPVDGVACPTNSEVGVSYFQPAAGDVQVCASLTTNSVLGTGGIFDQTFLMAQTSNNNDATLLQSGTNVGQSYSEGPSSVIVGQNVNFCNSFHLSAAGLTTFRLYYKQAVTSPVTSSVIAADGTLSGKTIYWSIKPLTQSLPAPVLTGSVLSSTTGSLSLDAASFGDSSTTQCTTSPCSIPFTTGPWLTSVTKTGPGAYALNFTASEFSAPPICTCDAMLSSGVGSCFVGFGNSTSSAIVLTQSAPGIPGDAFVNVSCVGAH